MAKKFVISCPLFDPAVFEHTHDSANGTVNATVASEIDHILDSVTSLSTSTVEMVSEVFNTTAADIATKEPIWLHPAQEKSARELYEINGPQECEAKPFALTSRVSLLTSLYIVELSVRQYLDQVPLRLSILPPQYFFLQLLLFKKKL